MKELIKSILRGAGTELSSKRFAFFFFILLFTGEGVMWYGFAKQPNESLSTQLFTLLLAALVTIFGEPALDIVKMIYQKKLGDKDKEL